MRSSDGPKEIVRRYRERPRPGGVCPVVHRPTGRTLLGASIDAPAMLNRIRAQLTMHRHPNRTRQAAWDPDGEAVFDFEVLDLLSPGDDPARDVSDDLETLLELWEEKLQIETGQSF